MPERTTSRTGLAESKCSGAVLRLLSYNVNFGIPGDSYPGQRVLHAVKSSGADIVALQETTPSFERVFQRELAQEYPCQYWRTQGAAGGAAFLSKVPFEVSILDHSHQIEGSWFETLVAHINWPVGDTSQHQSVKKGVGPDGKPEGISSPASVENMEHNKSASSTADESKRNGSDASHSQFIPLLIANVHLRPPVDEGGTADLGTLARTNATRRKEVQRIVSVLKQTHNLDFGDKNGGRDPSHAFFIVGDWNEPEHMPAMQWAKRDMAASEDLNPAPGNTEAPKVTHGSLAASSSKNARRNSLSVDADTAKSDQKTRFADAVEQYVPSNVETHRWPLVARLGLWMKNRLDHILYDTQLVQALDCAVMPGYATGASDHQPVLAAFALSRKNG